MENFEDLNGLAKEALCVICNDSFNDGEKLPEVLQCGHTYCHKCIKTKLACRFPECYIKFFCCETYTDDCLLHFFKGLKLQKCSKHRKELEDLKNDIVSKKKNLLKVKDEKLKILNSNLEKIETQLNNPEAMNKDSVLDIESIRQEVRSIINIKFAPKIFTELPDFPLSLLLKIHKKLNSGGKIFTIHQRHTKNFCTEFLCGKISVWDNNLYFHCLEQREPKDDEEFIRFDDLKTITGTELFSVFLKIGSEKSISRIIMIKPFESILLPNFVQLCLGERGTSYKNKGFKLNKVSDECGIYDFVKSCTIKMEDSAKAEYIPFSFMRENGSSPLIKVSNNTFVYGFPDGSFMMSSIYNVVAEANKTIIGRISSPSSVLGLIKEDSKIIDCGIAFIL